MSILTEKIHSGLKAELKDNNFAKALFNRSTQQGKRIEVADLKAFAFSNKEVELRQSLPSVNAIRDVRAKRLMLKGIRKFPNSVDYYYSIEFGKTCTQSAVFLGSNGVGKTSLYSALEWIYLQTLYSSRARGVTRDGESDYLKNISCQPEDAVIMIETANSVIPQKWTLEDNLNHPLSYPSFFCMEYDVEQIAEKTLQDYLAVQLDIMDFLDLIGKFRFLTETYNEFKELYESKLILRNYAQIEFKSLSKDDYSKKDKLKVLRIHDKELRELRKKAPLLSISPEKYDKVYQTRKYLEESYLEVISELKKAADEVFQSVFSNYLGNDIDSVRLEIDSDTMGLKVLMQAKDPMSGEILRIVNPREYLNTFRFKLYCVCLKMSLAFCCKRIYNMNAPIVIDDVFDSSDFQNRERIYQFISDIFEAHDKFFKGSLPLQLIFFTQDDIIGDSVFKGIRRCSPKEGVKYSRIFDYTMATDSDITKEEIIGIGDSKIIKIEDCIRG